MITILNKVRQQVFFRYLVASVGALSVDVGIFLILLKLSTAPATAAVIGYCAGILAHWLLSSRKVFFDISRTQGGARNKQKALFVGSALIGLAITYAIVQAGSMTSIDPRIAKLVAIAISFQTTWLLRRFWVFV